MDNRPKLDRGASNPWNIGQMLLHAKIDLEKATAHASLTLRRNSSGGYQFKENIAMLGIKFQRGAKLSGLLFTLVIFSSSTAFAQDGNYSGNRYLAKNLPALCKSTTIDGTISNGRVNLTLDYNGTNLSGRLSKSGSVKLTGSSGFYRYFFSGRLSGKKLSGTWYVKPKDCWGRWSVRRL